MDLLTLYTGQLFSMHTAGTFLCADYGWMDAFLCVRDRRLSLSTHRHPLLDTPRGWGNHLRSNKPRAKLRSLVSGGYLQPEFTSVPVPILGALLASLCRSIRVHGIQGEVDRLRWSQPPDV